MFYIVDALHKIVVSGPFKDFGEAYDNLRIVTVPKDYPDGGYLEIFGGL